MRVQVHVTQADINMGRPYSGCDCPVALAMHRALGCRVIVATERWSTNETDGPVPARAQSWIRAFDDPRQRHRAQPFDFEVEVRA